MPSQTAEINYPKSRKLELKKHVGTIQCSNGLSLLQRKITNGLLYHAYPTLQKEDVHRIDIKTLCQLIDYSSHDYKLIKSALRKLLSTVLEWNILSGNEDEEDVWTASSILASVSIAGSVCHYSYSPHMKKLLFMPSMYGRVDMVVQSCFKSSYGLALYENCIRYQNLPYTGWITISAFRKLMGVPPGKYKIFRDFKKRVIDKAVEEVNHYSHLEVVPEVQKEGRSVASVRFKLNKHSKRPLDLSEDVSSLTQELNLQLAQEFGLSAQQINNLQKRYDTAYIKAKVDLIKSSSSYQSGKIENLGSYLLSAVKKDYQPPVHSNVAQLEREKLKEQQITKKKQLEVELQKKKSAYFQYVNGVLDTFVDTMASGERDEFINCFENHLKQLPVTFLLKFYKRDGLENQAVRAEYYQFIKSSFEDTLPVIESESEFFN